MCRRAHTFAYHFPGVFEELHLSLYLPNLIQVPPPVANGHDVHVCNGELSRPSILP